MSIYKVEVIYHVVVRAADVMSAERAARVAIKNEDEEPDNSHAEEITHRWQLPPGWDTDCRPWGERDPLDRTLGEILKP